MDWVNLLLSSHKSYEYEAMWHGGGLYDGYYRESDPRPLLIVCSLNIAFLGAFLWLLPIKKSTTFYVATASATGLLLSLAYYNANIYFFIYLLYLICMINAVFREELCQELCDFFHKAEHKANLYIFISIMTLYLVFLFYFANTLAALIVCVSLVVTYFILINKVNNNFESKLARSRSELATLQEGIASNKPLVDALCEEVKKLTETRNSKQEEIRRQDETINANADKLKELRDHKAIVERLTNEKRTLDADKSTLEEDKARLSREKLSLEEDKATLLRETKELSSRRDTVRGEIGDMTSLRTERDNLRNQVRSVTLERDNYRAETDRALQRASQLETQYVNANDRIEALRTEVRSVTLERDRYRDEVQDALRRLQNAGNNSNNAAQLNAAVQKVSQLEAQYVNANDRIEALRAEMRVLTAERDRYREEAQAALRRLGNH